MYEKQTYQPVESWEHNNDAFSEISLENADPSGLRGRQRKVQIHLAVLYTIITLLVAVLYVQSNMPGWVSLKDPSLTLWCKPCQDSVLRKLRLTCNSTGERRRQLQDSHIRLLLLQSKSGPRCTSSRERQDVGRPLRL